MNKILRICKGNTFALKIAVEKLKNSNGSIVKEDFDLQACKEIKVLLSSKGKTIEAEFTAVGKTLTIKGDKDYEVGMYDLELVCVDADDLDLRFSKAGVFSIVRNTEEADIPVGVEFGIDNYYLGVISVTYATSVKAVTSVGASVPTGFKVSGSPITGSGIIAISFSEGYSLPSDSKQAEWDAKQNQLTAGENVTITNGVISATDTKIPESKQEEWSGKQDKLIEGDNIEIDDQNKISADLSSCAKNSDITNLQNEIDANASDIDALEGEVDAIKTRTTTAEGNITTLQGKVSSLETSIAGKQDTLTAGANITIEGNVISSSATPISPEKQAEWDAKQDKLIAGSNITIVGNTISATGGGSGGSIVYMGTIGTGGTITTLPTASSENAGWQYKVITAGTYSGIEANINDSFISNGSTWTLAKGSEDISKIGDLNDLTTSVKTSVVAAVNEVNGKVDTSIACKYTDDVDFAITDESNYSLVEFVEGHVKTKNFDSRDIIILKSAIGGNSVRIAATQLADGEAITVPNFPYSNKTGNHYSLSANVTNFDKLLICQGWHTYRSYWIEIDNSNIYVYKYETDEVLKETVAHGLTINDVIHVNMYITQDSKANVNIATTSGMFSTTLSTWTEAANGLVQARSLGSNLSNVSFSIANSQINSPLWIFGASYESINFERWVGQAKNIGYFNFFVNAYAGRASADCLADFKRALNLGCPKILYWTMWGNGTVASLDSGIAEVKTICDQKNITLIIIDRPNSTALTDYSQRKTVIDKYIAQGVRYVNAAKALSSNPSSADGWYDGYLASDGKHPTAKGAKALAMQVLADIPELMSYGNSNQ